MMQDLVLEWRAGKGDENGVEAILPNIQGQRYVFGSKYPGDEGREGEEFIFFRKEGIFVDHTHIVVRVDELGQYWIQIDTDTTKFKTFVNSERLLAEPRLLRFGDMVFFEDSEIRCGCARRRRPIFYVKQPIVPGSDQGIEGAGSDSDSDSEATIEPDLDDGAESPLNNNLILSEVMSYLSVQDLKSARLVCKVWKAEASKPLEKKGAVSFTFNQDYYKPENSTRVFRYLQEMRDMKMQSLKISLWISQNTPFFTPGEPGEKMMDDLKKLLNSRHNFSILHLQAAIKGESNSLPFFLIFQELGEKLVELKLEIFQLFLPALPSPLPVMRNLKKLTDTGYLLRDDLQQKLVSQFVPLFANSLEHFTCSSHTADPYFQEFLKQRMPNLKGITLKDDASFKSLSALLDLETPLTFLEIQYSEHRLNLKSRRLLLESLFLKNSETLQHLVLRIGNGHKDTKLSFPPFPKLVELEVEYDRRTRIGWGRETSFDYEDHFPSLRRLTVRPRQPWREDDHVFNTFFRRRELMCETVKELWVPVLEGQCPKFSCDWPHVSLESFQPCMDRIGKMFPNVGKISFFQ